MRPLFSRPARADEPQPDLALGPARSDYLAAILQSGADAHLSHYALEVAYRIAPPAPKPKSRSSSTTAASDSAQAAEREAWIGALFPQMRFGYSCDKLQERFDQLTVADWLEQMVRLLQDIAQGNLKRCVLARPLLLSPDLLLVIMC